MAAPVAALLARVAIVLAVAGVTGDSWSMCTAAAPLVATKRATADGNGDGTWRELTRQRRAQLDRDGWVLIRGAVPEDDVRRFRDVTRAHAEARDAQRAQHWGAMAAGGDAADEAPDLVTRRRSTSSSSSSSSTDRQQPRVPRPGSGFKTGFPLAQPSLADAFVSFVLDKGGADGHSVADVVAALIRSDASAGGLGGAHTAAPPSKETADSPSPDPGSEPVPVQFSGAAVYWGLVGSDWHKDVGLVTEGLSPWRAAPESGPDHNGTHDTYRVLKAILYLQPSRGGPLLAEEAVGDEASVDHNALVVLNGSHTEAGNAGAPITGAAARASAVARAHVVPVRLGDVIVLDTRLTHGGGDIESQVQAHDVPSDENWASGLDTPASLPAPSAHKGDATGTDAGTRAFWGAVFQPTHSAHSRARSAFEISMTHAKIAGKAGRNAADAWFRVSKEHENRFADASIDLPDYAAVLAAAADQRRAAPSTQRSVEARTGDGVGVDAAGEAARFLALVSQCQGGDASACQAVMKQRGSGRGAEL